MVSHPFHGRVLLSLLTAIALAACTPLTATPTSHPTIAVPGPAPTQQASQVSQANSPAPLPSSQAAHLSAETPHDFPSIAAQKWIDIHHAWAITADESAQLVRTEDGGQTWHNVMPAPGMHLGDHFELDLANAWLLTSPAPGRASTGTLYRTSDGGSTWLATAAPFSTAVLTFFDAQNGWAAATHGYNAGWLIRLYRTSDGGQTWAAASQAISPTGEKDLPPGALHLADAGVSFQDPSTIWINGTRDGVNLTNSWMVSSDGGRTWSERTRPVTSTLSVSLPIFLTPKLGFSYAWPSDGPASIFRTEDGGETWTAILPTSSALKNGGAIQFVTSQDWFAQCGQAICVTHDAGQTWQALSSNLDLSESHYLLSLDFIDAQTGWAILSEPGSAGTAIYALYHTADGGQTWDKQKAIIFYREVATQTPLPTAAVADLPENTPTPAPTVLVTPAKFPSLWQVKYVDAQSAFALTANTFRLLHSSDGGENWQDITPRGINKSSLPDVLDADHLWVAYNPAIDDPSIASMEHKDTVYCSSDAGRTWQKFSAPFSTGSIHMLNTREGWVIASPGGCGAGNCWYQLYMTQDGGQTWALVKTSLPSDASFGEATIHLHSGEYFSFQSLDTLWVGGGYVDYGPPAVLVSRDRGQTWQGAELPLPNSQKIVHLEVPDFLTADDGFLALTVQPAGTPSPQSDEPQSLVVLATHDGGITWQPLPAFPSRWYAAPQFVTPDAWFAACSTQICRTQDGGQTWQYLPFPAGIGATYFDFGFTDSQNGWALSALPVSESEEYRQLYLTHDGGETWTKISPRLK